MEELIEALTFIKGFMKDPYCKYPTACDYKDFYVCGVDLERMTIEDVRKLSTFGFMAGSDEDWGLYEYYFGKDFAYEKMNDAQWDIVKRELSDCVHSFRYGSR